MPSSRRWHATDKIHAPRCLVKDYKQCTYCVVQYTVPVHVLNSLVLHSYTITHGSPASTQTVHMNTAFNSIHDQALPWLLKGADLV